MRVIAGSLGGRRLQAPRGLATRPTSDRVREALFSVLADVRDARVLDLYAGTGALGIEALSRGARASTFVENGREALAALRANLASVGLAEGDRASVLAVPAARAAASLTGSFDLVFADPPYAALLDAAKVVFVLTSRGLLAPGARVVIEHASRDAAPAIAGLQAFATRGYGDTSVSLYEGEAAPPS